LYKPLFDSQDTFPFFATFRTTMEPTQTSTQRILRAIFAEVKRLGVGEGVKLVNHLHLWSGDKNMCSHSSTPPVCSYGLHREGRDENYSSSSDRPDWVLGPSSIICIGHRIVFNRLESTRSVKLNIQVLVVSILRNSDALPQLFHILPLST